MSTEADIDSKELAYSRGFDAGNYGNAYEGTDWESWYAERCDTDIRPEFRQAWEHGLILGFFSSYETHEIPDDMAAEEVATLRAQYGEE